MSPSTLALGLPLTVAVLADLGATLADLGATLAAFGGVFLPRYAYVASVVVASLGLYLVVADANLVKKVVGLNLFQTGVFLFFVSAASVAGGSAPLTTNPAPFVNPLPHVLILTAIVVGVSLTALALALVVRIHATYGSIDDDVVRERLVVDGAAVTDGGAAVAGAGSGDDATTAGSPDSTTVGSSDATTARSRADATADGTGGVR